MKALISGRILLAAVLMLPVVALAQTFPVRIERAGNNGVCDGMTASRMSVDPSSGRVTLEGVTGMTCLPDGAAGLSTISVAAPAGPHASGVTGVTATVQGIPTSASCTLRGIVNTSGTGIVTGAGWADGTSLCTNCGTSVNRVLAFDNGSTTAQWKFKLQVQCSLSSGGYAIQSPVIQSNEITVQPATVAAGNCPYGEQVPPENQDGLTLSSRQTMVTVNEAGYQGNNAKDATLYAALFGVHTGGNLTPTDILPTPGPSSEGYGYPGTHGNNFQFRIESNKFMALKFRAPQVSATPWQGVMVGFSPYSATTQGTAYTAVIAPCPGQFRSTALVNIPAACVMPASSGTELGRLLTMFTAPNGTVPAGYCPLELGKTYYLNLISANVETQGALTTTLCAQTAPGSSCNARIARSSMFRP